MTYYIVEHPTRGTLRDLETTDAGRTGRFSHSGLRSDEDKAMRFNSITDAQVAIGKLKPSIAASCAVLESRAWQKVTA